MCPLRIRREELQVSLSGEANIRPIHFRVLPYPSILTKESINPNYWIKEQMENKEGGSPGVPREATATDRRTPDRDVSSCSCCGEEWDILRPHTNGTSKVSSQDLSLH